MIESSTRRQTTLAVAWICDSGLSRSLSGGEVVVVLSSSEV